MLSLKWGRFFFKERKKESSRCYVAVPIILIIRRDNRKKFFPFVLPCACIQSDMNNHFSPRTHTQNTDPIPNKQFHSPQWTYNFIPHRMSCICYSKYVFQFPSTPHSPPSTNQTVWCIDIDKSKPKKRRIHKNEKLLVIKLEAL